MSVRSGRVIAACLIWLSASVALAQLTELPRAMTPANSVSQWFGAMDQSPRTHNRPPETFRPRGQFAEAAIGEARFVGGKLTAVRPSDWKPRIAPTRWEEEFGPGVGSTGRPLTTESLIGDFCPDCQWQAFPDGIIYESYLAGTRESRIGNIWLIDQDDNISWDASLGGRVGLLRYGTPGATLPQGFQLDLEGAAFPRLDAENNMDLTSVDFRIGVPLTYGIGRFRYKFAFYHLSSHLGDENVFRNNLTTRFNYSRDALVLGGAYYLTDCFRIYGEAEYAFSYDVSEPWHFQFGAEYRPAYATGPRGAPFSAINVHLREEIDFSGNLVVQTGWAWRGENGHLLRLAFHYYNGLSNQYEFFNQFEEQIGVGVLFDF